VLASTLVSAPALLFDREQPGGIRSAGKKKRSTPIRMSWVSRRGKSVFITMTFIRTCAERLRRDDVPLPESPATSVNDAISPLARRVLRGPD
jgi:hypothetical protein